MIDALRPQYAAAIAAVCTAAIFLVVGIATPNTVRQVQRAGDGRTCYPLAQWDSGNVSPDYRPCAQVAQVFEDGSVRVRVSDADGTVRWSAGIGARDR